MTEQLAAWAWLLLRVYGVYFILALAVFALWMRAMVRANDARDAREAEHQDMWQS